MMINPSYIKQRQDEIDQRKKRLLTSFMLFRDNFFDYLETFIAESVSIGVKSIEPLNKANSTDKVTNISTVINSVHLTILSSNEVFLSTLESDSLAAKIFFYENGSPYPNTVVIFQEAEGDKNIYLAEWFSLQGKETIVKSVVVNPAESGKEAGNQLLTHFYSYIFSWSEKPSQENFLDERYKLTNLGFVK